ncbi:MAG: hypothetical protein NVSMB6_14840 [Burkholderiaceae bacterium]
MIWSTQVGVGGLEARVHTLTCIDAVPQRAGEQVSLAEPVDAQLRGRGFTELRLEISEVCSSLWCDGDL